MLGLDPNLAKPDLNSSKTPNTDLQHCLKHNNNQKLKSNGKYRVPYTVYSFAFPDGAM